MMMIAILTAVGRARAKRMRVITIAIIMATAINWNY